MTIIDLRPYDKQPSRKPLEDLLAEHFKQIRGSSKIIYELPDEVWITECQNATHFWNNVKEQYGFTVLVKNDPTD